MSVELNYESFGHQGSPVLILHGLFGSSTNWRSLARKLEPSYRVFALNLRNHGVSPWTQSMTYPEMAEDIIDFIGRKQLRDITLIGHSLGGKVAMTVALFHRPGIKHLVIVDIAPKRYDHSHGGYIEAMQSLPLETVSRRRDADSLMAESIAEHGVRQFLLQNLTQKHGQFRWRINLSALQTALPSLMDFPVLDAATPFRGKTLFVYGEQSHYVQGEDYALIRDCFPAARINGIPRAGHWVHVEQPNMFQRNVDDFLRD